MPAPTWLTELRLTTDWQAAHTAVDAHGVPVRAVFPWAGNRPPSFLAYVRWLGATYGSRIAVADYSHHRFSGQRPVAPVIASMTTYTDLVQGIARRANWLRLRGIGPWDHIAICLPNSVEVLAMQYAAWCLGAIVSPINMDQKDRVGAILASAEHRVVLVDSAPHDVASAYGIAPETVTNVRSDSFQQELARSPVELPSGQEPTFDDPVVTLYTSGTTGTPKAAMLSPQGLLTGALALQEGFLLAGDDRFLMVNPLYHINSIAFSLALLGVGARLSIPPFGFHWDIAVIEQITITSMVQRHLTPVLRPASGGDRRQAALFDRLHQGGSLRWIAVGSGPLAPDVQEQLLERGVLVLFRWGMSENHLGSTNMRPGHSLQFYRDHIGSTGLTNRYLNLAVRDDDGQIREHGQGQLLQRGNIFVAYSTGEASQDAFAGGYHDTGDVARITPEGHVYIIGRTKETIIRSGENIYPQDVDNYLMHHPRIRFAQTVGYPHPDHSEEVGAFVVLDTGDETTEREIVEYAAGLGMQKRPKYIIMLDSEAERSFLRYSGPGKPQRRQNQALFWRMWLLDVAAGRIVRRGILPPGTRALAVVQGSDIGLLLCMPAGTRVPESSITEHLVDAFPDAAALPASQLDRLLQQHELTRQSLLPSFVRVVEMSEADLPNVGIIPRFVIFRRYAREKDPNSTRLRNNP